MAADLVVLVLLVVTTAVFAGALWIAHRVTPSVRGDADEAPDEAAKPAPGGTRRQYPMRAYLIVSLFTVLAVWMVFLQPWAAVFRTVGASGLAAIAIFVLPLLVGLAYEWRKGGLEG